MGKSVHQKRVRQRSYQFQGGRGAAYEAAGPSLKVRRCCPICLSVEIVQESQQGSVEAGSTETYQCSACNAKWNIVYSMLDTGLSQLNEAPGSQLFEHVKQLNLRNEAIAARLDEMEMERADLGAGKRLKRLEDQSVALDRKIESNFKNLLNFVIERSADKASREGEPAKSVERKGASRGKAVAKSVRPKRSHP